MFPPDCSKNCFIVVGPKMLQVQTFLSHLELPQDRVNNILSSARMLYIHRQTQAHSGCERTHSFSPLLPNSMFRLPIHSKCHCSCFFFFRQGRGAYGDGSCWKSLRIPYICLRCMLMMCEIAKKSALNGLYWFCSGCVYCYISY